MVFLVFWGAFGLSQLKSLQFIQYHVAGFYKPTIPQTPPSHLQDYSTCNNARLEFLTIFVLSFDGNEWCLKNGLHSGGLSPEPLGHESSALTTRPRLLAYIIKCFKLYIIPMHMCPTISLSFSVSLSFLFFILMSHSLSLLAFCKGR
jgi:hypothetical protein